MYKLYLTLFLSLHSHLAFAAIDNGRYQAGIGDPTLLGWFTVAAYLLAAFLCFKQSDAVKKQAGEPRFWLALAVILFLLGLNKQLDLQSWLTQSLRDAAHAHGWYHYRRKVQFVFIVLLGAGMFIGLLSMRLFLANSWRHYKLVCVGIALLATFVLMRAASFHHFDILINANVLGVRLNVWIELTAILLIILGIHYHKKMTAVPVVAQQETPEFVEIAEAGEDVYCPKCGMQALAAGEDGRLFKCRSCRHKYKVYVVES